MKKILLFAFLGASVVSCKKDSTTTSTTSASCTKTISYKTEIAPMMNTYCASCHSANQPSGGVNLSSYSSVSSNATRSLSSIKSGSMPPMGSIPDSLVQKLSCWISQGKANN
jgi:cytochrome c553